MGLYERLLEEREAEVPDEPAQVPEYPRGLHGRLLKERDEEERRRGRPLGRFHGLDSPALERAMDGRRPGTGGDLYRLYRFVHGGVHSPGAGMWFKSLQRKYAREYAEIKAERMGQGELW